MRRHPEARRCYQPGEGSRVVHGMAQATRARLCMAQRLIRRDKTQRLLHLHLYALPERHISFNLLRRRFRLRIKPRCSSIALPIHFHIVIIGRPFPRTHAMHITRFEIFFPNCLRRKILVALDLNCLIAVSQYRGFPRCFCHYANIDSCTNDRFHNLASSRAQPLSW
jgi:hypothetical protein